MASAGKSGSSFFLSQDRLFVVKSLTDNELEVLNTCQNRFFLTCPLCVQFLRSILLQYVHYRIAQKDSLLPRFYGLHTCKGTAGDFHVEIYNGLQSSACCQEITGSPHFISL